MIFCMSKRISDVVRLPLALRILSNGQRFITGGLGQWFLCRAGLMSSAHVWRRIDEYDYIQ